ncbi:Peroxiredoxin [Spraguea lophii 42_110]|uniref:Peroxiredoxin n=1 Tax=Spraguea lophii (strain 42_110) TaxID=1358809 RepID=S7XK26_SPRLO|nr:Peroxiredoxin [Spraguea lophii 42_110]
MMLESKLPDMNLKAVVDDSIVDLKLSDYLGKCLVLIFYPYDFTFVCPTEINLLSDMQKEFSDINTQVLFVSCDSVYSHIGWTKVEREELGIKGCTWPMVSDYNKELSISLGLLHKEGFSMRATVIADPEGIIKHISANNHLVGRNVNELLRLVKALQHVKKHGEICMVNWNI